MSEILSEQIKAVVFDFDDTLIGTRVSTWELHKHVAKKYYDLELDDEFMASYWGKPFNELLRNYYQTDNVDELMPRVIEHLPDFPKQKFEHSEPSVNRLKASGKILGIVSATTKPILKSDTDLIELPLNNFDYIQTSEDTEFHKPDPRVFELMLSYMSLRKIYQKNVLYVGDALHDMKAAKSADLNFLGVTTGLVSEEEFADHGVKSIPDLSKLI